jgi:hypothetical protein
MDSVKSDASPEASPADSLLSSQLETAQSDARLWKKIALALALFCLLTTAAAVGAIYYTISQSDSFLLDSGGAARTLTGGHVGTADTILRLDARGLNSATLHQLAAVHTLVIPGVVRDGVAVSGRVVSIAEIELRDRSAVLTSVLGTKYIVSDEGIREEGGNRTVVRRWSSDRLEKRQMDNSTEIVYASTFVPFDSSF